MGYKDNNRYIKDDTFGYLDYLSDKVEDIEGEINHSFERTFKKLLDEVEKGTNNNDIKSEKA